MAKILQANLRKAHLAQDLLVQFVRDRGMNLLILCEQYSTLMDRGWYSDTTGWAAVVACNHDRFPILPAYLRKVVDSYLAERVLRYATTEGIREKFADDVTLAVEAHTRKEAEMKIEWAVMKIDGWLRDHGLETEMVVLNRRAFGYLRVRIRDASIGPSHSVRYLGMWIDARLTFVEHIKKAAERAT